MSSLAELPELVGFFSYSRRDDEHSAGALSRLRMRIHSELRLQLGRDFRLWQDTAAIPDGALWEDEIKRAISEAVFFIPIVTPSAVGSDHCRFEFQSFLAREAELGRHDLVFPILYIRVPALEREQLWRQDDLLKIIGARQYADWQRYRHRDVTSEDVAEKIENFCNNIAEALRQPWQSPQERRRKEEQEAAFRREAEARQRAEEEEKHRVAQAAEAQAPAEAERRRQAAEAKRLREVEAGQRAEEEASRRIAQAEAQAQAEAERHRQEAEAERLREAAAMRRVEAEQQKTGGSQGEQVRRIRETAEAEIRPDQDRRRRNGREVHWKLAAGVGAVAVVIAATLLAYQSGWIDPAAYRRLAEIEAQQRAEEARKAAQEDARRRAEQEARGNAEEESKRAGEGARRDSALAMTPGAGQSFRDQLANGPACPTCPELVVVPPGSFMMGSPASDAARREGELPQHKVTLAKAFAVGRFAVTFDEWDGCLADGGCNGLRPSSWGWERGRRPVINVSWTDAKAYVEWLSRKTGRPYRLLSEAEREYVTRAGTTTPYWWGISISNKQANYKAKETVPVDSFTPNRWGLYQVHGNVREWTEDCWHGNYDGAPADGSAWIGGECGWRVDRGGSWLSNPEDLRSASRDRNSPDTRSGILGFRVGRPLGP